MPDAGKARNVEAIREMQQFGRNTLDALRAEAVGRSDPGMIEGEDTMAAGKRVRDRIPEVTQTIEPGNQDDWIAFAGGFVGELRRWCSRSRTHRRPIR